MSIDGLQVAGGRWLRPVMAVYAAQEAPEEAALTVRNLFAWTFAVAELALAGTEQMPTEGLGPSIEEMCLAGLLRHDEAGSTLQLTPLARPQLLSAAVLLTPELTAAITAKTPAAAQGGTVLHAWRTGRTSNGTQLGYTG